MKTGHCTSHTSVSTEINEKENLRQQRQKEQIQNRTAGYEARRAVGPVPSHLDPSTPVYSTPVAPRPVQSRPAPGWGEVRSEPRIQNLMPKGEGGGLQQMYFYLLLNPHPFSYRTSTVPQPYLRFSRFLRIPLPLLKGGWNVFFLKP